MVGQPWISNLVLAFLIPLGPGLQDPATTPDAGAAEKKILLEDQKVLLEDHNPALKKDAAVDLLKKKQGKLLLELLSSTKDHSVRSAIIWAFTNQKSDDILHQCLTFMALDRKDPLRADASLYLDVLFRKAPGPFMDLLSDTALDPAQPMEERVGAVTELGELKQLRPVQKLIQLLDASQSPIPQPVVIAALESITLRNFGASSAQWHAFFDQIGSKTREQLLEERVLDLSTAVQMREEEVASLAEELMRATPEALVHHLEHRDPRVRYAAFAQLPNLAGMAQTQPGVLEAARSKVFSLLRDLPDSYTEDDVARLIKAVGQSKLFTRPAGAGATDVGEPPKTGANGSEHRETLKDMVVLLQGFLVNGQPSVRAAAASALYNYPAELLDHDLLLATFAREQALTPPNVPLLVQLLRTLAVHWRGGDLSLFTSYLKNAPADLKAELLDTLGLIGDESVIPSLASMLDPASPGTDFNLRFRAAAALGDIGRRLKVSAPDGLKALMPILAKGLHDEAPEVRVQCAQTIGQLQLPGSLEVLAEQLEKQNERNPTVREALIGAIAEVGDGRAEALDVLLRALAREPRNGEKPASDALRPAIVKVADAGTLSHKLSQWAHASRSLVDQQLPLQAAWALDNLLRRMPPEMPSPIPDGMAPDLDTTDRVRFALARAYLRADQPEKAAKPFAEIAPQGQRELEQSSLYWQTRGQIAERMDKFDVAAEAYERQAKLLGASDTEQADVMGRAARSYLQAGKADKACELMEALLQRSPDSLDYLYLSGLACSRKGDFNRAIERLRRVVESSSPPNPRDQFDALEKLCEILQAQNQNPLMQQLLRSYRLPAALIPDLGSRLDRLKAKAGLN